MDPTNVAYHLAAMATRMPQQVAIYWPRFRGQHLDAQQLTFAELEQRSAELARGLHEVGVRRGVRTVLMVTPSLDFFALTFALFRVGAVPVLIDPGMGIRNLGICLAEAEPTAFIGIPKAHVARRVLRWGRATLRTTITTGARWLGGQYTLAHLRRLGQQRGILPIAETPAEETAAILFTSGSTGVAKGVVYRHATFDHQIAYLKQIYGIEPGEMDLSTFPLFALFAPALGMTAIIPEMDPTRPADVDPVKIIRLIEHYRVTNLFGSPALINRVGSYGAAHKVQLPTLRRVISAGAPVATRIIERFTTMLPPDVQLFTPYGATESLPVANVGSATILSETRTATEQGHGVCVGHPVPGMLAHIVPIHDEAQPQFDERDTLPTGVIGEIVVCGPVVTTEYYGRPEATQRAKMHDAQGRCWHRMGDVGYKDEQGRLWFCGRKAHRVVTPHETLFTIPCEGVFNAVPGVVRTALVGVTNAGITRPVLCVEQATLEASAPAWPILQEQLRERALQFPHTRAIATFLLHPKFPVDIRHNAKIFREKLAIWAAKQVQG